MVRSEVNISCLVHIKPKFEDTVNLYRLWLHYLIFVSIQFIQYLWGKCIYGYNKPGSMYHSVQYKIVVPDDIV